MSDGWVVGLALVVAAGAIAGRPTPVALVFGVGVLAVVFRRPFLLLLAAGLLASGLSANAHRGLHSASAHSVDAKAVLVGDPSAMGDFVRVDIRVGRRRMVAYARGRAAIELLDHLAGERVRVAGRAAPATGRARAALAVRHIGTRLSISHLSGWSSGGPVTRLANEVRRTLARGVESWPPRSAALFTGFVLGDDRGQYADDVDRFRASGLSHLLVVSGENVAFVLALVAPLLRRLSFRPRLVVGLAALAFIGTVTRWEPSVLRAIVMAGVTMTADVVGRPIATRRALTLTVAAVLLLDPLLVRSVGFLLSVGACTGIVLLGPLFRRRLPAPLAITLAAQAGVAPILIPVFGTLPLASLPANLLATPAAGPILMWGIVAGLPAGIVGGPAAALLHAPTRVLVAWIELVARVSASAPLPSIGLLGMAALVASAVVTVRMRSHIVRRVVVIAMVVVIGSGTVMQLVARGSTLDGVALAPGTRLWRRGQATVLMTDGRNPVQLLTSMRDLHVVRTDLLLLTTSRSIAMRDSLPARRVVVVEPGLQVSVGGLRVECTGKGRNARVRVVSAGNASHARPPVL